jgi:hypothetical protein
MATIGIHVKVLASAAAGVLALAVVAASQPGPASMKSAPAPAKAGPAFMEPAPEAAPAAAPAHAAAPRPEAAADSTDTAVKSATDTKAGPSRGIFVPKPKGAGDTLDETVDVAGAPDERTDLVTTLRGDQLHGNVLGITPRGFLRLTSPEFESEIVLATADLERIALGSVAGAAGAARPVEPKAGPKSPLAELVLAGGDRVSGTLVAIGTDAVTIDTPVAGRLRIATSAVRSIGLHRAEVLVDSAFGSGALAPWLDGGQGAWSTVDGAATVRGGGVAIAPVMVRGMVGAGGPAAAGNADSPLYAPLDQDGPVTIVAKVSAPEAPPGQRSPTTGFSCDLVLFADMPGGSSRARRYGKSSVFGVFAATQAYPIVNLNNASGVMLGTRSYNRQITGGVLRFAYDPAAGKAMLWLDEVSLGSYTVPNPLTSGKYVMFNSLNRVRVESLRVLRGIVPPEDDGFITSAPAAGETIVELASASGTGTSAAGAAGDDAAKERLSVSRVVVADGQATLTTSAGDTHYPLNKIRSILYGAVDKAAAGTPQAPGQGQVRTDSCWLTLRLEQITDGEVAGRSDVLGEVKVRRAAIREIRFGAAGKP